MRFEPKTDEQLEEENIFKPLPNGQYDFEVISAEDTTSKSSGAEMIVIDMYVYGNDGKKVKVRDWLVSSYMTKVKQFCDATGLQMEYSSGTLSADDCVNTAGRVNVTVDTYEKDGVEKETNRVESYVSSTTKSIDEVLNDDDIPFN